MRFFRYTRSEERSFLDSSFEPYGDGYLFYRHHWARGVPVTAEEREAYLRPPLDGSRWSFYDRIKGRRPVAPRRPYWRSYRITLESIPAGFGLGLMLLGAMLVWRGGGFDSPWLKSLLSAAGVLGLAYGAQVVLVRLLSR